MYDKSSNPTKMLPCPVQSTAKYTSAWIQKRPRITQGFGENPHIYKRFGMDGHNGVDYGIKVGTDIFSPIRGIVKVKNSGNAGYGLHIKIRDLYGREVVLAHLSEVFVESGQEVYELDKIGLSGNTGFSTGPHLHYGMRNLIVGKGDPFKWKVEDYDNGYYGYIDILPYTFTWKGTSLQSTL